MSHIVWATHAAKDTPEGRLGISDLLSCLESQGCYLFPLFLSAFVFLPSSLLFLSQHFSAKCLFAGLFFKENSQTFFIKSLALLFFSFFMALVG